MRKRHVTNGLCLLSTAIAAAVVTTAFTGPHLTIGNPVSVDRQQADLEVATLASTATDMDVDDFWTPERIKNAKPAESRLRSTATAGVAEAPGNVQHVNLDEQTQPEPKKLPARKQVPAQKLREAKRGERTIAPINIPGSAATEQPVTEPGLKSSTGRLFFSIDDTNYTCSATVVASNNKSVISTARHCGFGDGGTNYRFAPGYSDGKTPYGWWYMKEASWLTGGDAAADDVAFILLKEKNKRIGDVVGMNGIGFHHPPDKNARLVGIPGSTGKFHTCDGQGYAHHDGSGAWLMDDCNGLTGGASGGSFNVDMQPDGWGYQVGAFHGGPGNGTAFASNFRGGAHDIWNALQNKNPESDVYKFRLSQASLTVADVCVHTDIEKVCANNWGVNVSEVFDVRASSSNDWHCTAHIHSGSNEVKTGEFSRDEFKECLLLGGVSDYDIRMKRPDGSLN